MGILDKLSGLFSSRKTKVRVICVGLDNKLEDRFAETSARIDTVVEGVNTDALQQQREAGRAQHGERDARHIVPRAVA